MPNPGSVGYGVLSGAIAASAVAVMLSVIPAVAQDQMELRFAQQLMATSPEFKQRNAAFERFREARPDVELIVETSPQAQYLAQFNVGAAAGVLPDVFMLNTADITGLVNGGLVADITDEFNANAEWSSVVQPGSLGEFTRDGRLYGVPYGLLVNHMIFWNEDLFTEAGISEFPQTWEDLKTAITKLKDADILPISLGDKANWMVSSPVMSTLIYRTAGLDWYNRLVAGDAKFTDPEFIRAVELFKELVDMGTFNKDANSIDNIQQRQAFLNGEAAMFIEGSWAIPPVVQNAKPEVLAATRIGYWPSVPDGKTSADYVEVGAGWGYAMNANLSGERREAALDLLEKLSDEDFGEGRLALGVLPAQILSDTDDIDVTPLLKEVAADLGSGAIKPLPLFFPPLPRSMFDQAGIVFQEVISGRKSPEEVGRDLQKEFDRAR